MCYTKEVSQKGNTVMSLYNTEFIKSYAYYINKNVLSDDPPEVASLDSKNSYDNYKRTFCKDFMIMFHEYAHALYNRVDEVRSNYFCSGWAVELEFLGTKRSMRLRTFTDWDNRFVATNINNKTRKKDVEAIINSTKDNKQEYRTYTDNPSENFKPLEGLVLNKPKGGLWGCRGTEWLNWCTSEDYHCPESYFTWKFKKDVRIYTINSISDFLYLLEYYPYRESDVLTDITIDWKKLHEDGYNAVELTEEGNKLLHFGVPRSYVPDTAYHRKIMQSSSYSYATTLGMNAWDIPSICVFNPEETVEMVEFVKREESRRDYW